MVSSTTSHLRRFLAMVAAVLLLTTGGLTTAAEQTTPAAAPAALPGTPVGGQLTWVLAVLNGGAATLTPAEVSARFAPAFLSAVPAELVVALTQGWAASGPFALAGFTRPPTATQANALVTGGDGTPVVVPVAVEAAPPHRITGLNFAPVPPPPGTEIAPVVDAAGMPVDDPGRIDGLFDVGGGRRLYLSCVGTGSPTVVLEAGHNDPAAPWFAVERAVSPFARVCAYDRANTAGGASDPAPTPRTGADAVADLRALLAAAGVPGPYVLVGHSLGGHFARLYASTYPDEVAGLVLVDASHEDQDARLEALLGPELWAQSQAFVAGLNIEGIDLAATHAEVRAARAATPLRPMPLAVVMAGQAIDPAGFPPGWPVEEHRQLERELQADLAGLVPNARHVIATQSGHYVHQTEPELVVEAIRQVVAAVRDPSTWATPAAAMPAP
jgi:pimeloyl-ACP methyl ester carboxylesterase